MVGSKRGGRKTVQATRDLHNYYRTKTFDAKNYEYSGPEEFAMNAYGNLRNDKLSINILLQATKYYVDFNNYTMKTKN